jgi:hypothetical protein
MQEIMWNDIVWSWKRKEGGVSYSVNDESSSQRRKIVGNASLLLKPNISL